MGLAAQLRSVKMCTPHTVTAILVEWHRSRLTTRCSMSGFLILYPQVHSNIPQLDHHMSTISRTLIQFFQVNRAQRRSFFGSSFRCINTIVSYYNIDNTLFQINAQQRQQIKQELFYGIGLLIFLSFVGFILYKMIYAHVNHLLKDL